MAPPIDGGGRADAMMRPEPLPRSEPWPVPPAPWDGSHVEPLPRELHEPDASFLNVLRRRRSQPGRAAVGLGDLSSLLWHAMLPRERRPATSRFAVWESRPTPSAGGLHVISLLVLPLEHGLPAGIYIPARHGLAAMPGEQAEALAMNAASVMAVLGASVGVTLQFAADMSRADASYENCETLVWRDAGALLATLAFTANALGLVATPLGCTGTEVVAASGLPLRWSGAGAVHLTSSAA